MTERNPDDATAQLEALLRQLLSSYACGFSVCRQDLRVTVEPASLVAVMRILRDEPRTQFSMLVDISGVDCLQLGRPHRFEVIYALLSITHGYRVILVCALGADEPRCPTVSALFPVADWLERETWDQFGIVFDGHPNLRRLLNHKEFVGHPLRKDYPIAQRQPLSQSDDLMEEMAQLLARKGRTADGLRIESVEQSVPSVPADLEPLVIVNLGPAHPIVHGILRLLLAIEGETIVAAVPEIGYLHRGVEKGFEGLTYHKGIPFTDRMNYASPVMNNVGYCKAVERLMGLEITPYEMVVRVVFCELNRIMDHLLCTGPHLIDLGALTPFWYLFQIREHIYDIFEKYCGARLTYSCVRIGGQSIALYQGFYDDVTAVLKNLQSTVDDLRRLTERNRIFYDRCHNIGVISQQDAIGYGLTGPCLRATGVAHDLRKSQPYYLYDQFDFDVCVGTSGDSYDRFFVRVYEMLESAKIIRQGLDRLREFDSAPVKTEPGKPAGINKKAPPSTEIYDCTEAANGELGFYIVSDGSAKPYRLKVRSPSLCNYSPIRLLCEGGMIADLVSILGSINVIGGEIDR